MNKFSITFQYPWLLLLLIPVFAFFLIPYFRLPKGRRKTAKRIVPLVLHLVVASLLIPVLAGVSFVSTATDKAVLVLVDLSHSMEKAEDQVAAKANEILEVMDRETPVGVIAFGSDQIYSLKLSDDGIRSFRLEEVDSHGTDIQGAMELASTVFPSDKARHIILLTDGMESDGNAEEMALYLASRGARVDAVYFDTTGSETAEMQISRFSSPEGLWEGEELLLTAQLQSNTEGSCQVELYENDTLLEEKKVKVKPGSVTLEFPVVPEGSGIIGYRLRITPDADTENRNNQCCTAVEVTGKPSVLVLADEAPNAYHLEDILREDFDVKLIEAQYAPKTIADLCRYDEIVLSNIDLTTLPRNYERLLDAYVSVFGRSLLVAGGQHTYMYGNMKGTALEEMMPVEFTYQKNLEGKSVALMLVIDCSRSMSNDSNFISIAKQGAIKCVEEMTSNDQVGVISFHSEAKVQSPLVEATENNKNKIKRIISELTTDQKTAYTGALQLAREEMKKADADLKHIIFLSDGQPKDSGYYQVARDIAADGVTISTIGLDFNSEILEVLASLGGGRYHYVSSASDLPNIMLTETQQITSPSLVNETFVPSVARESKITSSLTEAFPELNGFLGTTLKKDATAYLTALEGEPLFATRRYGNGIVAAWTSDLNLEWSRNWMLMAPGRQTTVNMVDFLIADRHHDTSLLTSVRVGGDSTQVVVDTYGENADHMVTLSLTYGEETTTHILSQTDPGVHKINIPSPLPGFYRMLLMETDRSGEIVDYAEEIFCVSYSKEYDMFDTSGRAFLEKVVTPTGGVVTEDVKVLKEASPSPVRQAKNPLEIFSVLAVILFLVDVGFRKLRKKDFQILFQRLFSFGEKK